MSKHKTIRSDLPKLPSVSAIPQGEDFKLPFNGNAVGEGRFAFSFACFDREHEYFNLGGKNEDGTVGRWFLELMDCLKNVSNMTFQQLKESKKYDAHPVNWKTANVSRPGNDEQLEYWQFRINKSKGRVIGFLIDSVFYIVWLDPHHNLTNSEGYPGVAIFNRPKSEYEIQEDKMLELKADNERLRCQIREYEELLEMKTQPS